MRLRKMAAGVIAAAMAVASLPQVVSAEPEFGVGDKFYVAFNPDTGETIGTPEQNADSPAFYTCMILTDKTLSVSTGCFGNYYMHRDKKITIPDTIAGYTVTQIGSGASVGGRTSCIGGFASITIPDTVTTINQGAFTENVLLEEINFGASSQLKLIDQYAFQDCRSLKSIIIPASVETIAQGAFSNTEKKLDFDNLTNAYSLETVNFADNSKLKLIDQWAFQDQRGLKSITLPESLEKVGYGAFMNCISLTKIDIPGNVNEIGAFAFAAHSGAIMSITEINVSNNNKYFKSEDGVVFSKDGKTIVMYPTAKNGAYEIPSDVNKIAEAAFANSSKITAVTIPEGVTVIPENAFTYCTSLAEVQLPNTLTTIGKWAFEQTAFTSITIPASVKSIDSLAFADSALKTICGVEGSYAETYAKTNGYEFNGTPAEDDPTPDDSNTFTDSDGDAAIEVIDNKGAIPKEARFSVRIDDEHSTDTRIAYDCSFTYNGADYEPTDTVTVRIPVPVSMRDIAETLKVYHLQDGKYIAMTVTYEDGYLVFETDHFSIYVVTPETISEDGDDNNGDNTTDNTSDTEPKPITPPSTGGFIAPETTTTTATAADTTSAPQAAETTATVADTTTTATTTTTAAPEATTAAPASDNGTVEQPVPTEGTSDNGSANVGNDGAANDKSGNPDTGYAIAIVPMIVAAAAVSFMAYKRKK